MTISGDLLRPGFRSEPSESQRVCRILFGFRANRLPDHRQMQGNETLSTRAHMELVLYSLDDRLCIFLSPPCLTNAAHMREERAECGCERICSTVVSKDAIALPPKSTVMLFARFPGTDAAYNLALDCVDTDVLTDAQIYISTHAGAEQATVNEAFNISNGDVTRWKWVRAL